MLEACECEFVCIDRHLACWMAATVLPCEGYTALAVQLTERSGTLKRKATLQMILEVQERHGSSPWSRSTLWQRSPWLSWWPWHVTMISIVTKITIIAILILTASLGLNPEHVWQNRQELGSTGSREDSTSASLFPGCHRQMLYWRVVWTGRVAFQPQQPAEVLYIIVPKSSKISDYQTIKL